MHPSHVEFFIDKLVKQDTTERIGFGYTYGFDRRMHEKIARHSF